MSRVKRPTSDRQRALLHVFQIQAFSVLSTPVPSLWVYLVILPENKKWQYYAPSDHSRIEFFVWHNLYSQHKCELSFLENVYIYKTIFYFFSTTLKPIHCHRRQSNLFWHWKYLDTSMPPHIDKIALLSIGDNVFTEVITDSASLSIFFFFFF